MINVVFMKDLQFENFIHRRMTDVNINTKKAHLS